MIDLIFLSIDLFFMGEIEAVFEQAMKRTAGPDLSPSVNNHHHRIHRVVADLWYGL